MIIPNDWVCPFFITFGACMILATVTCCLFHLRKTRNRKKEITEWVNAMKFGGKVYHPLLHWIENNSDLSIKTRVHCSANEECKQRKMNVFFSSWTLLGSPYSHLIILVPATRAFIRPNSSAFCMKK
ncbi:uncharacterized protein LOC119964499 isoform X2 [Scyliorhinus canicula]|uniref:uncharacterized protein LOC119964499 isoform X2 n=1 Tax=Scyliorhinus canicula TaxID=7830 RepID=UPI0018F67073|nr:uncharacterized protein LOC119964499 isoform X2 [Scyliorhinus canicula]